jgi:hypothetical protein
MQNLNILIFLIFGAWLAVVSIFLYRIYSLFRKLSQGVEVPDLKKVLEKVLAKGNENTKSIKDLEGQIRQLEEEGKFHIQKVGFVRFNPFKELGGDHSFSIAILDQEDTGVIITSLHARDRTRVYIKDIKKGKCQLELSAEEEKALSNARKRR